MDESVHQARVHAVISKLERNRHDVMTAVELATAAKIESSHETKRRRVREIIAELREAGHQICAGARHPENADCGEEVEIGYWIARDATEWAAYLESVGSKARFEFVKLRTMREAATDKATGQATLFGGDEGKQHSRVECFSA